MELILWIFLGQATLKANEPDEVKRFREIIEAYQKGHEETVQEELITLRAQRAIAQKRLQMLDMQTGSPEEGRLKVPLEIKALKAEIDHYTKLIERIEAAVIQERRLQREQSLKNKQKK